MTPAQLEERIADIVAELKDYGLPGQQDALEQDALEQGDLDAELAVLRDELREIDEYHAAMQAARAELAR